MELFTISKEFHFSASHRLDGLADDHPCSRLHGHNYVIVVTLFDSKVDQNGFVLDYGEMKPFKEFIDNEIDHRHLNELVTFNPTAENLAKYFYEIAEKLIPQGELFIHSVTVKETPKTSATYEKIREFPSN